MDLAACFTTAAAAHNAGRLDEAERGYRAILAKASHLGSLHNLAVLLAQTHRLSEAAPYYRRAVELAPDDPARVFHLANFLRTTRRLPEAEVAYRRLLDLAPDYPSARFDLGCVLLAQGRFAEGWAFYQSRPSRAGVAGQPGISCPEWSGEPLAGKRLLIIQEQGLGDQIMMARYLPRLDAARVTYVLMPELRRLFAPLPVDFMDHSTPSDALPASDYWTLPFSIPHWLGAAAEPPPAPPYLTGRPGERRGRVGLAWQGQAANTNNRFRCLPQEVAAELLSIPGVISLDPADTGAQDLQATADIMAGLDLVISVDTATAHLAGAIGRPLWVLLAQHALDWQWPREGTSPWYPQARLCVQPAPNDWRGLAATIRADLARAGFS